MTDAQRGYQQTGSTKSDFVKQFNEMQKLINCPESKKIFNDVKGEDITIFIGNTRSGKSTLVNFVIGNQLKAVKMDEWPFALSVVKADDCEQGPVIGLESVSETTLPSVWSASKSGLTGKMVDAPGFEDNRGEAQDIANTFYIKEIIRNARSVKFVLITDINDIMSQNISQFTNVIDKIHRIFPDTGILHGGIALVFSKAKGDVTAANICSVLNKQILDQNKMQVEKSLIRYLSGNKKCIAFFNMPISEGPISEDDIDDEIGLLCTIKAILCGTPGISDNSKILNIIENTMSGINGKALCDVKPGLSDKSKMFLLQSYKDFCNGVEYVEILQKINDVFMKKYMKMSRAGSAEELTSIYEVISGLQEKVLELLPQGGSGLSLKNVFGSLTSLCDICGIINLIDSSNIAVHFKFVEFIDEILNMNNGAIYVAQLQETIKKINDQWKLAGKIHATALKQIRVIEAEKLKYAEAQKKRQEQIRVVENMKKQHENNERIANEQRRIERERHDNEMRQAFEKKVKQQKRDQEMANEQLRLERIKHEEDTERMRKEHEAHAKYVQEELQREEEERQDHIAQLMYTQQQEREDAERENAERERLRVQNENAMYLMLQYQYAMECNNELRREERREEHREKDRHHSHHGHHSHHRHHRH